MGVIQVRNLDEASFNSWAGLALDAFGGDGEDQESLRQTRSVVELDRSLAAFDGPLVVGTASSWAEEITLPFGASSPVAAVTGVAVAPTHRRRGILTRLMRQQLDQLHEQGEPLAALWASEAAIYPRFGYGLGTYASHLRVRRERSAFRRPLAVEGVVQIDADTARRTLPALQAGAAHGHPGFILRGEKHWDDAFNDPPAWRRGASRKRFVVHRDGTEPDGYAWYRTRRQRGPTGENESVLQVLELHAYTPEAYATLWRYCLDVDLMTGVEAGERSIDEPLRHLMADARAVQTEVTDGLWLRLVDVAPALQLRPYASEGELVLEVVDEFCPWNTGRVLLTAGEGVSRAARTEREPDLVLAADALSALYLGANRAVTLRRAGLAEERRPGGAERADRLFAADAAPWCPTDF